MDRMRHGGRRGLGAAVALAAALACASAPSGRLRVDLAGPDAGPGSVQERALVDTVREAADAEGLACDPGSGTPLLRCAPRAFGSRGHALALVLAREGSGYSVSIHQDLAVGPATAPCAAERSVAERIAAVLGSQSVRVDARSGCRSQKKK
jgi:hypothetical protein